MQIYSDLFLFVCILVVCVSQVIGPLHLSCQIWRHGVVYSIPLFFFNFHKIILDKPSYIFVIVCVFSLFFLVNLVKTYLFLAFLLKNQTLGLLIFFYCFSVLIFIISFLLPALNVNCFSFSSFL